MRAGSSARTVLLAAGLLAVAALPTYGAARRRTGPDSFLRWQAYTKQEFMSQVEGDAVLRQRLVKHFHVHEAELLDYLRANLRDVKLREAGWRVVYGVTRTGRIYKTRAFLAKGATALGLVDGTPVFRLPCGNPLITLLPVLHRPVERELYAPPGQQPTTAPISVAIEEVPVQAPEEYALLRDIPVAPNFVAPVTTEGRRFIPFWWPRGGDGDDHPPPPPPPPPIPEPGTLLLLGAGLAVLGGRFARRAR